MFRRGIYNITKKYPYHIASRIMLNHATPISKTFQTIQNESTDDITRINRGSPIRKKILPQLILNEKENDICNLLKDYCNYFNSNNNNNDGGKGKNESLVLRITGGWVRDKLLGQGSHDLDIAINIMSGETFALGLNEYLAQNYSKYGLKPHSIHKIDKNPEKSKHLETATTKLFDVEVDFVNLRSEEYTEISRIPIVTFGTPQQDALRRDATLNALFYNIQRDEIEDFTKMGLKDLQDGILRTPLPPRQTFLDDPLRVLRLIRFASRFNFQIEPSVLKEMSDPEINDRFNSKISRERIGVEMEKILHGSNPLIAWNLIQISHLENVIFFWHCTESVIEYNKLHLSNLSEINQIYSDGILNNHLKSFIESYENIINSSESLNKKIITDKHFKQNFILASSLIPFQNFEIVALPKKKVNNTASISECIIRDGLKMSKNDAIIVGKSVDSIIEYKKIINRFNSSQSTLSRSDVGLFLRSFRGQWELAHYVAMVSEYLNADGFETIKPNVLNKYNSFYNMIFENNLQNCYDLKPMIDGKKLQALLNMKPGKWMGHINDEAIKWQLDNEAGTEDQLLEHIKIILPSYL